MILSPSTKVKTGDEITLSFPEPIAADPEPQAMDLNVVFEDEHLLVINKPAGLVVHPAPGHHDQTLVNGLLYHCKESLSGIGGVKRPGIVHRLDQYTSGLMIVAKNDNAHQNLSNQLKKRTLSRQYLTFTWGILAEKEGVIEGNIGRHPKNRKKMACLPHSGKEAKTYYTTLKYFGMTASLVKCTLETGRTHQIRVHMASLHHGIINDPLYGHRPRKIPLSVERKFQEILHPQRQALHAAHIKFIHPHSKEEMAFECALPHDLQALETCLLGL